MIEDATANVLWIQEEGIEIDEDENRTNVNRTSVIGLFVMKVGTGHCDSEDDTRELLMS